MANAKTTIGRMKPGVPRSSSPVSVVLAGVVRRLVVLGVGHSVDVGGNVPVAVVVVAVGTEALVGNVPVVPVDVPVGIVGLGHSAALVVVPVGKLDVVPVVPTVVDVVVPVGLCAPVVALPNAKATMKTRRPTGARNVRGRIFDAVCWDIGVQVRDPRYGFKKLL